MSPSRRRALQLVAASTIPAAGCLTGSSGSTPTGTTTADSPTEPASSTPTPTGTVLDLGETFDAPEGPTVTVHSVRLRRLVRSTSVGSGSHIDVAWLDGHQFAVTAVEATGPNSELGSDVRLALDVDGTHYPQADQHWYWTYPPGTHIGATDRRRPAYPAPVADADRAAIVWRREEPVRWRLPAETVAALGQVPAFDVRSVTAPESVTRGSTFEATVTVGNTGDDGRFLAEFGAGPISDHGEFTLKVPGGGERTHSATMDPHYPEDASTVTVVLDWGRDRRTHTVTVE